MAFLAKPDRTALLGTAYGAVALGLVGSDIAALSVFTAAAERSCLTCWMLFARLALIGLVFVGLGLLYWPPFRKHFPFLAGFCAAAAWVLICIVFMLLKNVG